MAIKNTAKAEALIRDLKEKLALRLAQNAAIADRLDSVAEARDSDGYPYLMLSNAGAVAANDPVVLIRIKQIDAVSKNVFGDDLKAYAPHLCEMAYEVAEPSDQDLLIVMFELAKLGIKINIKKLADGTAVTPANVDAAAVAEELDWLHWPTKGV